MTELEIVMRCCTAFTCAGCGKVAQKLSTSWSTISWPEGGHSHRCLECRSEKLVWWPAS